MNAGWLCRGNLPEKDGENLQEEIGKGEAVQMKVSVWKKVQIIFRK